MTQIPRLHLIGPLASVKPVDFLGIATRAADGGFEAVHLRIHSLSGGDLLRMARSMRRELATRPGTILIINDRVDVALLTGADGVQLGERGFNVADARRLVGERMLVGRSIHNIEGAKRAEEQGASYLIAGHVYETRSKEGEPGRGIDWLEEITGSVDIPVIGIGGITLERIPEVLAAGALRRRDRSGTALERRPLRGSPTRDPAH